MIAEFVERKHGLPSISIEAETDAERLVLKQIVSEGSGKARIESMMHGTGKPGVNSITVGFKKRKGRV